MEEMKRSAARHAADRIHDGMRLGLGTGSTIRHLLDTIAERLAAGEWRDIRCVPTSEATRIRAEELGIPLATLSELPELDLTIDGADEVDPGLHLIKGLGGALLREKIVASVSRSLVIVVDRTKLVPRLGTRSPLPVEVDPFAAPVLDGFFRSLGATATLRHGPHGEPFLSDGGHRIFDCRFQDGIADPAGIEMRLNNRPGVVENGLFLGMADSVIVADESGTREYEREQGRNSWT